MDLSDREEEEEEGIMPGLGLTVLGRGTGKYRECLKNHAATMGGHATDGCGEFMPSGEEGSLEALKCAACHCHRNFHRRDSDYPEEVSSGGNRKKLAPLGLPAPAGFPAGQMIMAFGGAAGTDEHDMGLLPPPTPSMHHHYYHHHHAALGMGGGGGGGGSATTTPGMMAMGGIHMRSGKRFRTKFTTEQKEKMKEFAEKVGWRIQKQDEAAVQRLLAEVGVKRNVFKVWMHNNKNTYTKSNPGSGSGGSGCLLLPDSTDCANDNNADGNGNINNANSNNGGNGNSHHHNDENANTSSNNNDEYDDDEDEDDEDDDDDEPPSPTPVMIP